MNMEERHDVQAAILRDESKVLEDVLGRGADIAMTQGDYLGTRCGPRGMKYQCNIL